MKKQATRREYNFTDSQLYIECLERLKFVKRDAKEFAQYGYGAAKIANFEALCQKVADLPTDDELVGEQMLTTQKKYELRDKLKSAIRSVMTRVETRYDVRTGRYRKFGTTKIHEMNDAALLLCAHRVVRVADASMSFLAETGLTQALLDEVRTATAAFENAVHIQLDRVAERDIAVENRVDISNVIYSELVIICNIGKDIWAEKNRTHYDNYCIFDSNAEEKRQRRERLKAEEGSSEAANAETESAELAPAAPVEEKPRKPRTRMERRQQEQEDEQ